MIIVFLKCGYFILKFVQFIEPYLWNIAPGLLWMIIIFGYSLSEAWSWQSNRSHHQNLMWHNCPLEDKFQMLALFSVCGNMCTSSEKMWSISYLACKDMSLCHVHSHGGINLGIKLIIMIAHMIRGCMRFQIVSFLLQAINLHTMWLFTAVDL